MAGTAVQNVFEKDGQYLSFLVSTAAITLGEVVAIDDSAANSVVTGTAALKAKAIGVAVSGERFSRTSNDGEVAVGRKVTVITRGVVNVESTAAAIDEGDLVEAADDGKVVAHTPASAGYADVLGIALSSVGAGGGVVQIKLLKG